jgi:hypothetical protein
MIGTEQVARLIGKNVELICFAQYSIYIHLQGDIMLTVEGGLEHVHNGTRCVHQLSSPLAESSLLTILESTVTYAMIDLSGDFHLILSNGDTLRIFKESPYESYRLKIEGEEITT